MDHYCSARFGQLNGKVERRKLSQINILVGSLLMVFVLVFNI